MKSPVAHNRKTDQNRFGRRQGFSLVETIVAFVILGIILLAIGFLPIMTTRLMSDTSEREKATLLAIGKLDSLEADFEGLPMPGLGESTDVIDFYTLKWSTSGTNPNEVRVVTLGIEWHGVVGKKQLVFQRHIVKRQ